MTVETADAMPQMMAVLMIIHLLQRSMTFGSTFETTAVHHLPGVSVAQVAKEGGGAGEANDKSRLDQASLGM